MPAQVFLSYAAEDRDAAESIQLALLGAGYRVFFDRQSLPAAGDYYAGIQSAVSASDFFVFLVSAHSVAAGSFALTELKQVRAKWPHPKGRVLPVLVDPAGLERLPNYLRSVTFLEPEGHLAAEVLMSVDAMARALAPEPQAAAPVQSVAAIDFNGLWRTWTGGEFNIVQSGNAFTFVAVDRASGLVAEGSGTIDGRRFKSIFRTNMPSTGTGEGSVSNDGQQITGIFDDSRLGRYTQVLSR